MKNLLPVWCYDLSIMRLPLYCFLLLLCPFLIQAQKVKEVCGIYHKPLNESSKDQVIDLVDQFGNGYTFDELNVQHFRDRHVGGNRNISNCTGGEFVLEFIGLTCDEEITICNVFQEISALIDVGPNGSSPIITVIKEPFLNPDGTNDSNTLGTGTTFFQLECGIANNLVFDVMYSDIANDLPAGQVSGVLRLNDLFLFYNDVQGPVSGNYDLHTVALHEVLHILGFSSRMQDGGGGDEDSYSRWDTHLFSNNNEQNLIVPGNASPDCCDFAVFNSLLNYNQVITADCDMNIFFRDNGQNIAEAYGENYPSTNPAGLLSHLDRCNTPGDQYVMSASLAPLEEKDITQEEIDILEALGYEMEGQDIACSVIANNDLIFLNNTNPGTITTISYNQFFNNDNLPDGFDQITDLTLHLAGSGCGTIDEFTPGTIFFLDQPDLNRFRIRIPLCSSIDICYTITGCEGACDDGTMTIERICDPCYPQLPNCPPADICAGDNLFCYGDFQDFIPKSTGGVEPVFELDSPHCPNLQGTPDLFYNPVNGNRVVGFFSTESIIIPLSAPVAPGCSIDISFRTTGTESGLVNVFGTSISPCQLGGTPICPSTNQSDFQCIGNFTFIDGINSLNSGGIPCDGTSPPDIDCTCTPDIETFETPFNWTTATLPTFVNNSNESIRFLYFNTDVDYAYLDDLVVTANCENVVTSTVDTQVDGCRGGEAEIEVVICLEGTNATPNDITVTADFPNLLGLNITHVSDFDGGTALISNAIAGSVGDPICYTLHFNLEIGYNIAVGTQLEVIFEVEAANSCPSLNNQITSIIDVIPCEIPCILQSYSTITASCNNDGAIDVIVAGGSGDYNYQWGGGFGNNPSINGLAPGTYELLVTDATDPSCFIKEEFTVPEGDDCNTSCAGDGTIEIAHEVVQIVCLESEEPGFDRYYIDMYIPNWGGTQNVNFELCSEDLFVTTPGVILESNESYLIQEFDALNIFTIIQVPTGTPIDQAICFETPICIGPGQFCGSFCVTDFPICTAAPCELEVVPTVTLSPLDNTTCGNLSGDDLFTGNVSLAIQNANGFNINYVQYIQINGNIDPVFWQENNIPVIGGIANVPDHSFCWKSYDNQYFCFTVRIGYSDGIDEFGCEVNICLTVSDLLQGMLDDGGGERRQNDLSFHKDKYNNTVFPIFPNPVNQNLNIQNPQETSVTLTLMTLQGKLLDQQVLNGHAQTRMKVDAFAPGIYLLRIRDASSGAILQMEKVIVAH